MKIGILGTGPVAEMLAAAWTSSGHSVQLGSRKPGSRTSTYPVADLATTVAFADVVVNAVLGSASLEILASVGDAAFEGRVLVDVANALTDRYELVYPNSSLGELLQLELPSARVVKTMNTGAMSVFCNPDDTPPSSVFLSGDDADAKATTALLLTDLGWKDDAIVDLGGIKSARGPEHYYLLLAAIMKSRRSASFNIRVVA